MTEELDGVYEKRSIELNQKIANLMKKNENLAVSIFTIKDNIAKLNEELGKNADEVAYYEDMLKSNQKTEEGSQNDNDPLIKAENEEDSPEKKKQELLDLHIGIIHENMLKVVDEFDRTLQEQPIIAEVKNLTDTENLTFSGICVSLADGDLLTETFRPILKYQTFRLSLTSTFKQLKETCFNLWDLKERANEFNLKLIENENLIRIENEDKDEATINGFLKVKSSLKKVVFVLTNMKKLKYEDVINQPSENKNQTFQKQSDFSLVIEKFFQKFVGLKEDMTKSLEQIEHDKNKPRSKKEEKKTFNKCAFSINLLSNIIFIVFFFFTLLSLMSMLPTNNTFAMRETLAKKFGMPCKFPYLDKFLIMQDLYSRLDSLFLDPVTKRPPFQDVNSQASPMRISFYNTKKKDSCAGANFTAYNDCYYPIFDSTTADKNISNNVNMNSASWKNYPIFSDSKIGNYSNMFYIIEKDFTNYVETDYVNLQKYYDSVYKPILVNQDERNFFPTKYSGRIGTYDENSSSDLWISPQFINFEVFKTFWEILADPKNPTNFIDRKLRAVTFSWSLFNNVNKFYFYVYIIYEWPIHGGVLPPVVNVSPFLINVYDTNLGSLASLLDILRLIFSLIMLVLTLNNFAEAKSKLHETQKNMVEYLKIFLSPKMVINLGIMILYMSVFVTKVLYLSSNASDLIKTTNEDGYLTGKKFDFYITNYYFEVCIILETAIIFLLFFRIIFFFYDIIRTQIFFIYIFKAFANIYVFLLILIMILLSQSIFANNIWGEYFEEYRDIQASIVNTLLFSIGHYQRNILESDVNKTWTLVYSIMFFFIIIYFFMSTFVGIYLEAYRLNALKNGYGYDLRMIKLLLADEPVKKKSSKDRI